MTTFARKHFARQQALAQAKTAKDDSVPTQTSAYELKLMQLSQHQRSLKSIDSRVRENIKKAEFLSEYQDYLDAVIESQAGVQDDVLARLMVWHIDCLELERAIELGRYMIEHDLVMPEGFTRKTPAVLAEEIADVVLKNKLIDDATIAVLDEVNQLVGELDKSDEIQAKLHKALGLALADNDNSDIDAKRTAMEHLKQSVALNEKGGAKKRLNDLTKEIAEFDKVVQTSKPATAADTATADTR